MMKKNELMKKIQETAFALTDTSLFLDSHPNCRLALSFFADTKEKYDAYVAEYESNYGPLIMYNTDVSKGWGWIQSPWPWELEA